MKIVLNFQMDSSSFRIESSSPIIIENQMNFREEEYIGVKRDYRLDFLKKSQFQIF
jgi:hypothetical protein